MRSLAALAVAVAGTLLAAPVALFTAGVYLGTGGDAGRTVDVLRSSAATVLDVTSDLTGELADHAR